MSNVVNLRNEKTADELLEEAKGIFENVLIIGGTGDGRFVVMHTSETIRNLLGDCVLAASSILAGFEDE